MPQTAILNNCERLIQIRVNQQVRFDLLPGVNVVASEHWAEALKNPTVQTLLRTKIEPSPAPEAQVERVGQPMIVAKKTELADGYPLKDCKDSEAVALIAETLNPLLLDSWYQEESREGIRKHIDNRRREIDKTDAR